MSDTNDTTDDKEDPVLIADFHDPLAADVADYCAVIENLGTQIKNLTKTKEVLSKDLKELTADMTLPRRLIGSTWELRKVRQTRRTIVAERLLERGVPMAIIEDATEVTETESVAVYSVKKKGEKGGGE